MTTVHTEHIDVHTLEASSAELADDRDLQPASSDILSDIQTLMQHLSERATNDPLDDGRIRRSVASPSAAQLIAIVSQSENIPNQLKELREVGPIVGAATLSTLHGVLGEKAWLEDFVVVPEARGLGVGQILWDSMSEWRRQRHLREMRFTSNPSRAAAHAFYLRNECRIIAEGETTLFSHTLQSEM